MEFQKVLVTPTIAKAYLEANIKNRSIKRERLFRYAKDMSAGRWKEDTAEVIKISKTGVILDGQHRLHALIKANVNLFFHVATGVDDSVFDVLDTGAARNATDVFFIEGIKMSSSIPSIISTYKLLKGGLSNALRKDSRLTNSELLDVYHDNEKHWQHVAAKSHCWYVAFAKILTPSVIGGMYALFLEISEEDADSFLSQLSTGINLTNSTIGLLRQKLMQDKMAVRKMQQDLKNALIIKAWNYFRKGEEAKILKFDIARDNFPIPV